MFWIIWSYRSCSYALLEHGVVLHEPELVFLHVGGDDEVEGDESDEDDDERVDPDGLRGQAVERRDGG